MKKMKFKTIHRLLDEEIELFAELHKAYDKWIDEYSQPDE